MNDRFKYPPFFQINKITLKHRKDFEKVKEGSMWLYQVLRQNLIFRFWDRKNQQSVKLETNTFERL
jgi:hypothetical protein